MSGQQRGPCASVLRGAMAAAEPIYSAAVSYRNRRFDAGRGVRKLPRPAISVGNITAGGTGKTPVVQWLCEQLRASGRHPAILLRGYKSKGGLSDEQRMLDRSLNGPGLVPIVVQANPDRFAAGNEVLRDHPDVDLFVLDDGFQHRRLARDFDLVLISATDPFGFNHVHPRGLLREPLSSLKRAGALLITRASEVDPDVLAQIERRLRQHSPTAPIYHADHIQMGVRSEAGFEPIESLAGKRIFAFCGLGNPASFFRQLQSHGADLVGSMAFPDHHAYDDGDLAEIDRSAGNAQMILTTEKDWVKLAGLPAARQMKAPLWRVEMQVRFRSDDGDALLSRMNFQAGAERER